MVRKHNKISNCYIPFEVQEDIMKRLPVKSLIRFRSVSKPWKSLIDSSKFINDHTSHHDHPQYMLLRYNDPEDNYTKIYVSIVDNNTFPQHQFPLLVPVSLTLLVNLKIGGHDQGLVCFYSTYMDKATIWNPTIRKSVDINVPIVSDRHDYFISLGVCRETKDPKLVKITKTSIPRQIEVYTVSTRVWRSVSINFPGLSVRFKEDSQVAIDGFIYWLAYKGSRMDDLIMLFDLTIEKFTEIYLPDGVVGHNISLFKLQESLVVLEHYRRGGPQFYGVWVMEKGISKSLTKVYDIEASTLWITKVHGFRKNGEPIIQMDNEDSSLHVYDPYSQHIYNIGIYGRLCIFFVCFYMETLLLLDQ